MMFDFERELRSCRMVLKYEYTEMSIWKCHKTLGVFGGSTVNGRQATLI